MKASESLETRLIDSALRAWKFNADRIDKFFGALSPEQLEQEIAPGRNRLVYLWGHIAALNDGLLPLMALGPRLYPEMEVMFIANPDRAAIAVYSAEQVRQAWNQINERLLAKFSGWSPAEWLHRHTAVSAKDFLSEPHRNRYSVLLSMNTHMAFHFGQAILAKPRDRRF
jgi:DinB superfamily